MTTLPTPKIFNRAPRSESQGKRATPNSRRAFDPIAYAAALEVLG